ncbi:uncharacterized protein [Diadema setosum]|uniref:uncharacterized protein n=1 Tax=Diadema setosum TaxID=31175 RepID=UPI003B3B1E6D
METRIDAGMKVASQSDVQSQRGKLVDTNANVTNDQAQLGDVISPRTWSEIIAQDIAVLSEGSQYRNEGSDSCAENKLGNAMKSESGTKRRLYIANVHVIPKIVNNRFVLKIAAAVETSSDLKDLSPDPLSSSIQYAWPNGIRVVDGQGSSDSNQPDETRPENTSPGTERLESSIQMLRRELKSMRQIDQKIFRQLLRNYEMIGEMLDHVHVTMVTPSSTPSPYPASPCSTPSSPEKSKTYAADSGDADLLNIVREALAQPGSLNIQKIVTQLSPIRRRRSSEPPPVEYDDLPLNFDAEDDDIEADDLLSFSCPVLKQPVAPSKRKSLPNLPDGT